MGDHAEDRIAALESVWYDVIEAVNAGRTAGLKCPECSHADDLQIAEQGRRVTVACANCQRVVEVAVSNA